ncbi:hypothetical protein TIFTF001_018804 [Ficus carica]|uniref:Uncharacterized protein n=1 Tax=Ficus carica TaxID=3494 RepID=A0AA88ABS3_FICCA|nr:hypothetical protein TIFTF001_018804 [Ficus carica]
MYFYNRWRTRWVWEKPLRREIPAPSPSPALFKWEWDVFEDGDGDRKAFPSLAPSPVAIPRTTFLSMEISSTADMLSSRITLALSGYRLSG